MGHDFPETVYGGDCNLEPSDTDLVTGPSFRCQYSNCGGITVYADDSTYTVSNKDQEKLSNQLSEKFSVMAEYLTANRLKVNSDKTHLIVGSAEESVRDSII